MPDPNVELVAFIAETAADAVAQVRERLGPQAVVVNVRPLPPADAGWFRKKRQRFEVLAYKPAAPAEKPGSLLDRVDSAAYAPPPATALESSTTPAVGLSTSLGSPASGGAGEAVTSAPAASSPGEASAGVVPLSGAGGHWRIGALLESSGFLPANAQRVADELRRQRGELAPETWAEELALAREALTRLWRKPVAVQVGTRRPHVLIGGPGVGKTTGLCKWLTQVVLVESRAARVWRLDGATANTGEALSVYCEILGVPWDRVWRLEEATEEEIAFIDLPGVDWRDAARVKELGVQLRGFGQPQVHLVLNGAYDISVLLAQVRAFSVLPVTDLVVTHLDEETRWGKLWNLVLGTNYSVRFLSAGQNIPGEFLPASPEAILVRQFPS